ncbi:hypothetical protein DPMN_076639 [Dreissena polymorpha]|uniref:Uncharacterized protein n=1 Tax=Dreissena polymorpha TaxID=45954 RepID=A0A9D3YMR7_DREPO|nr:hypothetical protein DPMN_076639 [Dreissena polymorpha]
MCPWCINHLGLVEWDRSCVLQVEDRVECWNDEQVCGDHLEEVMVGSSLVSIVEYLVE